MIKRMLVMLVLVGMGPVVRALYLMLVEHYSKKR